MEKRNKVKVLDWFFPLCSLPSYLSHWQWEWEFALYRCVHVHAFRHDWLMILCLFYCLCTSVNEFACKMMLFFSMLLLKISTVCACVCVRACIVICKHCVLAFYMWVYAIVLSLPLSLFFLFTVGWCFAILHLSLLAIAHVLHDVLYCAVRFGMAWFIYMLRA